MIRISATQEPSHTTVTVDGDLSRQHIDAVESCCREAESFGKPVRLFLRDITAMDHHGQTLLSRLVATGVTLHAEGVYTSYLVDALRAPDGRHPTRPALREQRRAQGPVRR